MDFVKDLEVNVPEVDVEFSDKDNWSEVVSFKALIQLIVDFILKIVKFEFVM